MINNIHQSFKVPVRKNFGTFFSMVFMVFEVPIPNLKIASLVGVGFETITGETPNVSPFYGFWPITHFIVFYS